MSSTVIKNGTVVTADLSYEADVKIEGGVITEIGKGLKGDEEEPLGAAAVALVARARPGDWRRRFGRRRSFWDGGAESHRTCCGWLVVW